MTSESHSSGTLVILGGLLSLAVAAFGLMAIAWGFKTNDATFLNWAFFLIPILWLPVYLVAASLTRFASHALWLMLLLHWISYISLLSQDPHRAVATLRDWLEMLAMPLFYPSFVPSILAAAFVTIGTRHATLYLDKVFKGHLRVEDESND
jgi:hypothetical protein